MRNGRLFAMLILAFGLLFLRPLSAAEIVKNQEPSTQNEYRVVNNYHYSGFNLIQFHLAALAHYSYLLVSGKEALVVDPGRDVSVYLDQAKKEGARITGVFLTHNHADFVAGHMELAKRTNCPIFASADSGCLFRFQPLKEGSTIAVGEVLVKILMTPGHTPESITGLVASKSNDKEPHLLLSGDTLWIGRPSRPDLIESNTSAAALAAMAFDTWRNKLRHLPDNVAIFPAHGGGILNGTRLSDEPSSTLGIEKRVTSSFRHKNRLEFITALLEGLPEVPQYFKHDAAQNKRGPQLVDWERLYTPVRISIALRDPRKFYVVDLRSPQDYASGHIPNSVNIGLRGSLETWVGTMVPWDANLVLFGSPLQLKEATTRLAQVGYSAQVLTPEDLKKSRISLVNSELLKPSDLKARMQGDDSPLVVDVRPRHEWESQRLGKVLNLPLTQLSLLAPARLDPAQPMVTVSDSAYYASLAVGILERLGFKRVGSLEGGRDTWAEAGLPVLGGETSMAKPQAPFHPPRVSKRVVALPQSFSPEPISENSEKASPASDSKDKVKEPGSVKTQHSSPDKQELQLSHTEPQSSDGEASPGEAKGGEVPPLTKPEHATAQRAAPEPPKKQEMILYSTQIYRGIIPPRAQMSEASSQLSLEQHGSKSASQPTPSPSGLQTAKPGEGPSQVSEPQLPGTLAPQLPSPEKIAAKPKTHRVTEEDSNLTRIVSKYYPHNKNLAFAAILLANPLITSENLIYAGQHLILPEVKNTDQVITLPDGKYYAFYDQYISNAPMQLALKHLKERQVRFVVRETQEPGVKVCRIFLGGYDHEADLQKARTIAVGD